MRTFVLILLTSIFLQGLGKSQECYSIGTSVNAFTKVDPPTLYRDRLELGSIQTAHFEIEDYDTSYTNNLPYESQAAVLRATEIWSYLIESSVPITVAVRCTTFSDPTILASTFVWKNLQYDGKSYPAALYGAITGHSAGTLYPNMIIFVNKRPNTSWYFGTDGITQPNTYDFLSIILHEIGHGLGFTHSFSVMTNGFGRRWGDDARPPNDQFSSVVYDEHCQSGQLYPGFPDSLIFKPSFPDSSLVLGNALRSGNIYFIGPKTNEMSWYPSYSPKLYAPQTWTGGSSISHLDSTMFHTGSSNSLMIRSRDYADAVHSPGEIGLAILADLGWATNRLMTFILPAKNTVVVRGDFLQLEWSDNEGGIFPVAELMKRSSFNTYDHYRNLQTLATICGHNAYSLLIPADVDSGWYNIRCLYGSQGYGATNAFYVSSVSRAEMPIINPPHGYYPQQQNLVMTQSQGASIHYTLNGNGDPTETDSVYSTPVPTPVNTMTTVRARAFLNNGQPPSLTRSEVYYIGTVPPPTVTPDPGTYPYPLTIHMEWQNGTTCFFDYCPTNGGSTEPLDPICYPGCSVLANWHSLTFTGALPYRIKLRTRDSTNHWSNLVDLIYTVAPSMRIAQVDSAGASFGTWNKWESGWHPYPDTILIRPPVARADTLKASQSYKPGTTEKYNAWATNDGPNVVVNHSPITITPLSSSVLANFKHAKSAIIQAQLMEGGSPGGTVGFKDPWLVDTSDSKGSKNRGLGAIWHRNIPAPFDPSLSTLYKGVFLNENTTFDITKPNYSVGAPPQETFNISGQQYTSSVFVRWDTLGAIVQNPTAALTGVVFKQDSAVVTAKFKGHLTSNSSNALGTNQQRKLSRWRDGVQSGLNGYTLVYESGGQIWNLFSNDFGTTWLPEQLVSSNPGAHSSPSLAIGELYSVNGAPIHNPIVWHTNMSGVDQIWCQYLSSPVLVGNFAAHSSIPAAPVVAYRGLSATSQLLVACTGANGIEVMKFNGNTSLWARDTYSDSLSARYRPSLGYAGIYAGNPVYLTYDDGNRVYWDYFMCYDYDGCREMWRRVYQHNGEKVVNGSVSNQTGFRGNSQVVGIPTGGLRKFGVVWETVEGYANGDGPVEEVMQADEQGGSLPPADEYSVRFQKYDESQSPNNEWSTTMKFVGAYYRTPTISHLPNNLMLWTWTNGQSVLSSQSTNEGSTWSTPVTLNQGVDPQTVIGAENQNQPVTYAYRSLSGPIYQISLPQTAQQEEDQGDASREVAVTDDSSNASMTIEMAPLSIETSQSTSQQIPFAVADDSGFVASVNNIEQYLGTAGCEVPQNGERIKLRVHMRSKAASSLASENMPMRALVYYTVNDSIRHTVAQWRFTGDHFLNKVLRLSARPLRGKALKFYVSVLGLNRGNPDLMVNAASVYRARGGMPPAKSVAQHEQEIPRTYGLSQNYPNPFNPSTRIHYELPNDGPVQLVVYDVLGREVATLVNELKPAGGYDISFNTERLSSGVYFYRMNAGSFVSTKRMVVLK